MQYMFYVGPFIKAKTHVIDNISEFGVCLNKTCKNFSKKINSSFCPDCGNKTELVKSSFKMSKISGHDFCEKIKNKWSNPMDDDAKDHQFTFLPNTKDYKNRFIEPCGSGQTIVFDEMSRKKELDKFRKDFAEEIKLCGDLFDNFEIYWGVFSYFYVPQNEWDD